MPSIPTQRYNPLHFLAAFASGGLLTLAVFVNGEAGRFGGAMFSSWLAHGVGTIVAIPLLALVWRDQRRAAAQASETVGKAPLWGYLGGIIGAATVMLTSTSVNSPLALAGTLALGLAGQVILSLAADFWGLLGLPRRRLDWRDAGAVALIAAGSLLIILFGLGAA
ncbi:DMT family transporter [Devosia sp. FJ2-5-3]|jgi:transporter family-2 protein|uniref:DMT family transporter n=1 Tax=Devosia sp. FJ2-5-3 TaxID=2976680 RepID=UPI0023D7C1C1|nr:DMT family transporter [Devosia sp. FJ2-5-3]WEJ59680.1 DMT family transporter [Devosia sp. FJ2-5-3]